jgi:hypothetical protein
MDPLKSELKEFIELHTLLSIEYKKYPPSSEDLDHFANYLTDRLHVRLQKCLEAEDQPQAESFIAEIQALACGLEPSLRGRLQKVTLAEMDFFNREWKKRHSFRPGVPSGLPSKAERQRAASKAYEKMMRSMGH